jgi:hypothetical protein
MLQITHYHGPALKPKHLSMFERWRGYGECKGLPLLARSVVLCARVAWPQPVPPSCWVMISHLLRRRRTSRRCALRPSEGWRAAQAAGGAQAGSGWLMDYPLRVACLGSQFCKPTASACEHVCFE